MPNLDVIGQRNCCFGRCCFGAGRGLRRLFGWCCPQSNEDQKQALQEYQKSLEEELEDVKKELEE